MLSITHQKRKFKYYKKQDKIPAFFNGKISKNINLIKNKYRREFEKWTNLIKENMINN